MVTVSQRMSSIKVWVNAATKEEPLVGLSYMPRCPFAYPPPVQYMDHCQPDPTYLEN